MSFQSYIISDKEELELDRFREMDYFAVEEYHLPIELMMENAGLHLATLIASFANLTDSIQIGIGNGNNGGGGLVAARRLVAWGYQVTLDLPAEITKELPKLQLSRALAFGAKVGFINNPVVWVDAYLGFSQRLPLQPILQNRIAQANQSNCLKISLDIPTGFLGDSKVNYFKAEHVLSLAAAKRILSNLPHLVSVYIADIGIPKLVYEEFGIRMPSFCKNGILKLVKS